MIRWDDARQALVVGDREWPGQKGIWMDYEFPPEAELLVMHERQALVMFETGWMVSVIWGDLTYSSNYNARYGHDWAGNPVPPFTETPELVEVGVLRPNGLAGDPFAYLDDDVLNLLLDRVQTLPTDATDAQVESLVLVGQGIDNPDAGQRPEVLGKLMHGSRE